MNCSLCREWMDSGGPFHPECALRSVTGGVAHLEGRCSCYGGTGEDAGTYREQGLAAQRWIREHE